ncbi:uncharacterized protein LY89DRAFT_662708 [Mollisia scopiformis]|uniref:Uncharacterized protein n=1 Tax=Mollisia scopiformis TaxID=149040 RepID=A0A194XW32_MOLSC|nr:uncharacterized protein LY89DRAFT_662708 [Mollisia scopiformis]KUJ23927.1 hypothetical protein LY89DRAFT_662708 [Mollisia scopiformis]
MDHLGGPLSQPLLTPKNVIVGIEIGMTCTGVAVWSDLCPMLNVIQKWPMRPGSRPTVVNKVPTKVAYEAGKASIDSWGFGCPEVDKIGPAMAVKDLFKFLLDRDYFRKEFEGNFDAAPGTVDDVALWYGDFLRALHEHIVHCLEDGWNVDLELTKVEYNFSIPTPWADNDKLIEMFRDIVEEVGFAHGNESVVMQLTEAEASAVFTVKQHKFRFKDMGAMQVVKVTDEAVQLDNLDQPKALPVGSLNIDDLFERYATRILDRLRLTYPHLPQHRAHQIMRNSFQVVKHAFGTPAALPISRFEVSVPPEGPEDPGEPQLLERIELTHEELKAMFDEQLVKIFEFIDNEIAYLKWYIPDKNLSYLILNGEFCSSRYVQDEIARRYNEVKTLFPLHPEDGPLTVCKGLVIDRLQKRAQELLDTSCQRSEPRRPYRSLFQEIFDEKNDAQFFKIGQLRWNKPIRNRNIEVCPSGNDSSCGGKLHELIDDDAAAKDWYLGSRCCTTPYHSSKVYLRPHSEMNSMASIDWRPSSRDDTKP